MSWLRNNDPNLDDVDFATAQALEPAGVKMPDARYDPVAEGSGTHVMDEAMNWLRNNER
jgi:hypothetical protein